MCDAYRYTLIPAYLYIFRTSVNQCLLLYWFSISASGTGASRMQTFQNRHGTLELWNPYYCSVEKPGCHIHPKHKLMYT